MSYGCRQRSNDPLVSPTFGSTRWIQSKREIETSAPVLARTKPTTKTTTQSPSKYHSQKPGVIPTRKPTGMPVKDPSDEQTHDTRRKANPVKAQILVVVSSLILDFFQSTPQVVSEGMELADLLISLNET